MVAVGNIEDLSNSIHYLRVEKDKETEFGLVLKLYSIIELLTLAQVFYKIQISIIVIISLSALFKYSNPVNAAGHKQN